MTKPIIKIHDLATGEEIERQMNEEELAQWEIDNAAAIALQEEATTKAAEKAELLTRLGLSADEAKLLLS